MVTTERKSVPTPKAIALVNPAKRLDLSAPEVQTGLSKNNKGPTWT